MAANSELLYLPHHSGFWEFYHSLLPPGWEQTVGSTNLVFFAPSPESGALIPLTERQLWELEEGEDELLTWIDECTEPEWQPPVNWYPFMEFDEPEELDESEFIL